MGPDATQTLTMNREGSEDADVIAVRIFKELAGTQHGRGHMKDMKETPSELPEIKAHL